MTRSSKIFRNIAVVFLFVLVLQACVQFKADAPPFQPTAEDNVTPATEEQTRLSPTSTATIEVEVSAQTEVPPTTAPVPSVTLNVVKGNLFIRRGPDMAFNPIGVLYKGTSVKVIAQDMLSKWVQIQIPHSDKTGWVSIQTDYSQIEGKLEDLPAFTTTEWPKAAYLRNCTYHRMYVLPSEVVVYPSLEFPNNEIWIYPGEYTVQDIDVDGDPEVMKITVQEGSVIEIREDGSGEKRKCP